MKKDTKKVLLILAVFIILPLTVLLTLVVAEKNSIEFRLKGSDTINLELGETYKDEGFIAKSKRRDLKKLVTVNSDVDTKKVGNYKIKYNLKVKVFGIDKTLERSINIKDNIPPILTITSSKSITYTIGERFKYPTYEAKDNYDGDITDKVQLDESKLNLKKEGTYEIIYTISDTSGNTVSDTVKVTVKKKIDAYIDINITKQKLTYYENNEVILVSDIVTGNISAGNNTPLGTFQVLSKAMNVTLKGDGYESKVTYWIAFKGHSYGMHDAYWRYGKFGGDIYKTNGSHGCVNMPLDKVKVLYERAEIGTPVYIHE